MFKKKDVWIGIAIGIVIGSAGLLLFLGWLARMNG